MATFRYTNLGGGGAQVLEAPDRSSALRELMGRGVTPATLEEIKSANARSSGRSAGQSGDPVKTAAEAAKAGLTMAAAANVPGADVAVGAIKVGGAVVATVEGIHRGGMFSAMSLSETASFISELATALQAGLPLIPALRTLGKSGRTPAQKAMLNHLINRVEQGGTLAEACRTWGKPFNELIINLVRAGEASGRIGEILQQTAELVEKDLRLRRSLLSATLYPLILLVLSGVAIIIVTTFIVPSVLKPFEGQNISLPWPTLVVQGFAGIVLNYWWAMIGGACIALLAYFRVRATPGGRLAIDRVMLSMPLMGALVRDAAVARFTRTLGTLVKAGLPVLTALRLTSATLGNMVMRRAMDSVCEQVAGGKTIAGPLESTGLFPPLLVQIVSLGERSGKLPDLLSQAATAMEGRTETRVKVITTILPPILVVGLACVVGFVVLAILLALLQLQDAAGKL
jgi:type II secretory pathway component PulF